MLVARPWWSSEPVNINHAVLQLDQANLTEQQVLTANTHPC